jgi:Flp pilus assembly protein TadD
LANLGSLAGLEASPAWAVTILKDCAARFPSSDVVRYNLGSALRATGDVAGAERELRTALQLAGPAGLRAVAVNELALVLVAAGRAGEAVECVRTERPLAPGPVETAVLTKTLGIALFSAGRLDEAVAELRAALAGSLPRPLRAETLVAAGQALERQGKRVDAAEAFAQAAHRIPQRRPDAGDAAAAGKRCLRAEMLVVGVLRRVRRFHGRVQAAVSRRSTSSATSKLA